jgi:hypothetical protein
LATIHCGLIVDIADNRDLNRAIGELAADQAL